MKVGVTGGIGSGKTSVCKVFSVLGIPVFSADQEAKEIMDSDPDVIRSLISLAGDDIYSAGSLNRQELASMIFNDQEMLQKINSLVHPVVFDRFHKWTSRQTTPYVIMEAAILFESGGSELMDRTITVVAPEEERINRVTRRNELSRENITDRIKNQMDDQARSELSDYIVRNSEYDMIIPAILEIHDDILRSIKNDVQA